MPGRSSQPIFRSCLAALTGLFAAACAAIPTAPDFEGPPSYNTTFSQIAGDDPVQAQWWSAFDDQPLERLILSALENSPALKRTDFTIAGAEAALRLALLGSAPSFSSRASANIARPAGASSSQTDLTGSAILSADWEADMHGRISALIEAAVADVGAARELRRDMAVTIASAAALAYIDLRSAEARLSVAHRNAQIQAEGLALVETLFSNGRATRLDIERADTLYRTTLASLPVFQAQREAALFQLAALTGLPAMEASGLEAMLAVSRGHVPVLAEAPSPGTPDQLIRRRPDIRLAEQRVASALALGARARADLFPRISVSTNLSGLLREGRPVSGNSIGFSVGPVLSWAGPDLRPVYARIDAGDARTGELIAEYERTVLAALSEVETALSDFDFEQRRTPDLESALSSARRSLELARLRFEEGLDSYLNVLDAQRSLLDAEDRLAVNRAETARRAIRAYRSLGGIWTDEELAAFRAG